MRPRYFEAVEQSAKYTEYDVAVHRYQHIFIENVYVLVPSSYSQKSLEKMIEAGLGDRDFSYKVPKIVKIL